MNEFENNNSNSNNLEEKRKKSNLFNIIIGVSTLIIAILGITFAYFSATASSEENDVNVRSAHVSISYLGGTIIRATNLIPSSEHVVIEMYKKATPPEDIVGVVGQEGLGITTQEDKYTNIQDLNRKCVDAKGHEVCAIYQFTIKSEGAADSFTDIAGGITVNKNDFPGVLGTNNEYSNLSYVVYEVDFEKDETAPYEEEEDKIKVDKYGNKVVANSNPVSDFRENVPYNKDPLDPDNLDIPTISRFERVFEVMNNQNEPVPMNPVNCLFGYLTDDEIQERYPGETIGRDSLKRCKTLKVSNQATHTYQIVIWLMETGELQNEQGLSFQGTVHLEVPTGGEEETEERITGTTTNG